MFSRSFRKHGVVLLAIFRKGDMVNIEGMDTVQKERSHKGYRGKTGRAGHIPSGLLALL